MDIPIKLDAFAGRGLAVRTAGAFKGARLVIDGEEVKGKHRNYSVRDNAGVNREIRLSMGLIDPVPKVVFGGRTIEVTRRLAWYEYAWSAIPILMVFRGGAIGGTCGVLGTYASFRVFRSDRSTIAKFGLSALITIGAVIGYAVVAAFLYTLLERM